MATIRPFRAVKYNLNKVGSAKNVICPPYDVISDKQQKKLYQNSPYNIIRLELPKGDENKRYSSVLKTYSQWQQKQVLVFDDKPGFYLYVQDYKIAGGKKYSRYGFFTALKSEPWGKNVRPHEKTFPHHKKDRLEMLRRLKTNISPIFGIFPDPQKNVYNLLLASAKTKPAIDVIDDFGIRHRLWQISQPEKMIQIKKLLAKQTIYIADGHHRYETAHNYWTENKTHPGNQYLLAYLCPMEAPGLVVLPTHRVVELQHDIDFDAWLKEQEKWFSIKKQNNLKILLTKQKLFGLVYGNKCYALDKKPTISNVMKTLLPKSSDTYRNLDVTVLHNLLFKNLPIEKITYYKSFDDAKEFLNESKNKSNKIVFIMNATKIDEVRKVASTGEIMPEKSTYFYPKLATGLVMYSLENSIS